MKIQKGYLYHIYNQGNNKRRIFFSKRNYLFFKDKIRTHILPYADIIAWCLMPNHFHLMIYVKEEFIHLEHTEKKRSINDSIGILLRSYARVINKQEKMSGSLFRKETKAICINDLDGSSQNYFETSYGTDINLKASESQYPQVCFDYIHNNPRKAGLVTRNEDWQYSSFMEYKKSDDQSLINKERAKEFLSLYLKN